ncbi:endonuclease/exonuclease/phosphatase family protein [Thalassotalea sp. LPB0316]|uniref:endonuclease/exonuclease/phosphatase family protein n=1 Tax=Thalassotalea sp. LPB0316 TaxID=2769490 RepID=UPI001868392E|nr:endonuclease/exonuclease/phosphatase family protein [Thalassotalea sp. LPB0316]QOL25346.1 endonuclease/exonuclease/phosphatase family protein [Thalassotalea sp. LPB0316]
MRLNIVHWLIVISLNWSANSVFGAMFEQEEALIPQLHHSVADVYSTTQPTKLKLLTLNLAHGRGDSVSQLLLSKEKIKENLNQIGQFLSYENADVVALQEADAASWWSGEFDHVAYLAGLAGYRYYIHGKHVDRFFGRYGTAILSKYPITNSFSYRFAPTPPTPSKGFVVGQINLPCATEPTNCHPIDIYSIHLDFSRQSKRLEQIAQLNAVRQQRQVPSILLGDFNATWQGGNKVIGTILSDRSLTTYFKYSNSHNTYGNKRLDWIFIPKTMAFLDYQVADQVLSDHQAVVATVLME